MSDLEWVRRDGVGRWEAEAAAASQASAATLRMSTSPNVESAEALPFDIALADTDGYFDPDTHGFVVPAGKGGLFLVGAEAGIGAAPALATHCEVQVDNSGDDRSPSSAIPFTLNATVSSLLLLAAGDALHCRMLFDDNVNKLAVFGNQCEFWLVKVT